MKHPFAVGVRKLVAYLLNPAHPDGGSKAKYLIEHGFDVGDPESLASALLEHWHLEPALVFDNQWGTRYIVDGPISAPDGQELMMRTVWQTPSTDDPIAQLVTAYPLR